MTVAQSCLKKYYNVTYTLEVRKTKTILNSVKNLMKKFLIIILAELYILKKNLNDDTSTVQMVISFLVSCKDDNFQLYTRWLLYHKMLTWYLFTSSNLFMIVLPEVAPVLAQHPQVPSLILLTFFRRFHPEVYVFYNADIVNVLEVYRRHLLSSRHFFQISLLRHQNFAAEGA